MSELTTDIHERLPSAARRERGFSDARHGHPATSLDDHYLKGYRLGERLRPTLPARSSTDGAKSPVDGPGLSLEDEIKIYDASLILAMYVVYREAGIPTNVGAAGGVIVALKNRLSQIRRLAMEGDTEGLKTITAPTSREAEFVRLLSKKA